jgi:hypothetical protein
MTHVGAFLERFAHVKVQLVIHATLDQRNDVYRFKNVGDNSC